MGTPFLSEIRIMAFDYPPKGWTLCNGQILPINQNQALFSLLGTTYGGNGQTTFGLPNLQGRVPLHFGDGIVLGQSAGQYSHTLTNQEMPAHTHMVNADGTTAATANANTPTATVSVLGQSAGKKKDGTPLNINIYGTGAPGSLHNPATVSNFGGNQAHLNQQPYLTLSFCICLQGIFPSQN
jgi:microcystin-dependent protein